MNHKNGAEEIKFSGPASNEQKKIYIYFEYISMILYVDYHILVYHLLQSSGKLKRYIFSNDIRFQRESPFPNNEFDFCCPQTSQYQFDRTRT